MSDSAHGFRAGLDDNYVANLQVLIKDKTDKVALGRCFRSQILRKFELHVGAVFQDELWRACRLVRGRSGDSLGLLGSLWSLLRHRCDAQEQTDQEKNNGNE